MGPPLRIFREKSIDPGFVMETAENFVSLCILFGTRQYGFLQNFLYTVDKRIDVVHTSLCLATPDSPQPKEVPMGAKQTGQKLL